MSDALWDLPAERVLVGWAITHPSEIYEITRYVTLDDFADPFSLTAMGELTKRGRMTIQQLDAMHEVLDLHELRRCAQDARYRDPGEIRALAIRVAERALARRADGDARETIVDAANPFLEAPELVQRVKDRAARLEAPDAPPADPALTLPEFMAVHHPESDWLIPNLIERGDRIIFTATGGVGKSTLLRQVAVCAAAGRYPFAPTEALPKPVRVLMLDLENSMREVQQRLRYMLQSLGHFDGELLHIKVHPEVIDVTESAGYRWLFGHVAAARPDLIVCGPVYRLYEGGDTSRDTGGRDKARRVALVFDQVRERHGCALLLEAHPPKGSLTLSPFGSAVWEWWPDLGMGLEASKEGPNQVTVKEWRHPRYVRNWPKQLQRGGPVGWRSLDDERRYGGLRHGPQTGQPAADPPNIPDVEDGY